MGTAGMPGLIEVVPELIKSYVANDFARVPLGQAYSKTLMAVDISGNVAKKTISISAPPTGIKLGNYSPTAPYMLPAGFDCIEAILQRGLTLDGRTVMTGGISDSRATEWGAAAGYYPAILLTLDPAATRAQLLGAASLTPLSSTSMIFNSLGENQAGSWYTRYFGTVSVMQTTPPTISVTMRMECNFNGATTYGQPATFSAQMPQ